MTDREMVVAFGRALRGARHARGFTQKKLASMAGVTRTTVCKYEGAAWKVLPTLYTAVLLARALRVPVSYLLRDIDPFTVGFDPGDVARRRGAAPRMYAWDGKVMSAREWAARLGVHPSTFRSRAKRYGVNDPRVYKS